LKRALTSAALLLLLVGCGGMPLQPMGGLNEQLQRAGSGRGS
jgi:hypothetical protein